MIVINFEKYIDRYISYVCKHSNPLLFIPVYILYLIEIINRKFKSIKIYVVS